MVVWRGRETADEHWSENLNTGVLSLGQPARCMWYLAEGWAWYPFSPSFLELWVGPGCMVEGFSRITQGTLLSDLSCGPMYVAVGAALACLPTL